jgi:enterochelin esterase family protein
MNKNMKSIQVILVGFCLLSSTVLFAQWGRNAVKSPEIHENSKITFRLYAPNADTVKISGNWMPGWGTSETLVPNDTGLFVLTIDPLPSEMYTYAFYVNGLTVLDPSNNVVVRDGNNYQSMFFAPGDVADLYETQDVPHGVLSKVWYPSPTLEKNRRMYVYTPPGYAESDKKYPVFYLLHGAGGDEDAWTTLGRTPYILDNLIAVGKAEPMIVVMTNGNSWSSAAPGEEPITASNTQPDYSQMASGGFEKSLVNDVIPFIEKNYRALTDKEHRAIAGLSMGGMHTQNITNWNPGKFGYIGVMSIGIMNNPRWNNGYNVEEHSKQIAALKDSGLKLYWIGCGKEDFLFESVTHLRKFYDENDFEYIYRESAGGHTWTNWRIYLGELAPLLFK